MINQEIIIRIRSMERVFTDGQMEGNIMERGEMGSKIIWGDIFKKMVQ